MCNGPQVSNINIQYSPAVLTCFPVFLGTAFHTNLPLPGWLMRCVGAIPSLSGTTLLSLAMSAKQGFMGVMKEPCESEKDSCARLLSALINREMLCGFKNVNKTSGGWGWISPKRYLEWLYACVCKYTLSGLGQLPGRRLANLSGQAAAYL